MAPSRELSFVLCGDHFISLVVGFFLLDISRVPNLFRDVWLLHLSSPFAGGNRRRVPEAIWRGHTRRRRKTRGVFVVGFTNASASIHGSLCVEQGTGTRPRTLSSLHCAQYKTDREETRFFLGFCGRGFRLSLTSDPPSPPNLSLFSCCCALDRGSCIRT
jgi:hypothetical protein